jgi:(2Fe-2S) ferredoxin
MNETNIISADESSAQNHLKQPYFKHHVFFCLNQRAEGEECCANHQANELQAYMKAQVKLKGLSGEGKVRVNKAGCLDRCNLGPVCVVYPEGTWYQYMDKVDIDEIIDSHLVAGKPVDRLKLD